MIRDGLEVRRGVHAEREFLRLRDWGGRIEERGVRFGRMAQDPRRTEPVRFCGQDGLGVQLAGERVATRGIDGLELSRRVE